MAGHGLKMPFRCGLPETGCGAGSKVSYTAPLREWLPGLFRWVGAQTLLDAPCGDFNWMAHTDLSSVDYIGADYDPDHLHAALARGSVTDAFRPRSKSLVAINLARDPLPPADLMLCREFLQHLPNAIAADVIRNFKASGIPWVLLTSHDNALNDDIAAPGGFRPLNLRKAPFDFPPPSRFIEDCPGSGRILGLWHRDDILD